MSKFNLSDCDRVCPKSLSELMQALWASSIRAVVLRLVLFVRVMFGLLVLSSVFASRTASLAMSV